MGGTETRDLIRNGAFADDSDFWTRTGDFYADRRFNGYHDGPGYAYLSKLNGDPGDNLNGTIYQQVAIPGNATSATLSFWTKISTSEPSGGPAQDFLNATLQDDDGDFRASLRLYSNQDVSSGYVKRVFDLANFIGETIRIHFLGTTNGDAQPTVFRIDDVSLEVDVPSGGPPEATTNAADQVYSSSARLNMAVNPNGADTEIWFDLEPDDSTPNDETEHINIGAGSGNRNASISVFGLECGTNYYFRAHAKNSYDRADASVKNFTTSACSGGAPHADTDPAENITQTSATLTADVDANGLPTEAWFVWGNSPSFGQETPHLSVGSGAGDVDFSQTITGLQCGTSYYFENHAGNSAGEDEGVTLEFTTTACNQGSLSVITVIATDATATENPMTSGTFSIQRTGSTSLDLSVAYEISGTAQMGVDHTLGQGSVTIPAGASSRTLTVLPLDDLSVENDETVVLTLQPSSAYSVGSPASAVVTIISDDGTSPMIFEDDMESGSGRWNYQGTWARTQSSAHSPTYSWTDSPAGNYANNSSSYIAVGGLDLRNRQAVQLSFWHHYQFADSGDIGRIWVRADDGGFPWQVVRTFSGTSSGWTLATVDLSALAGMTQVVIAFEVVTNASGTGDGWYIDDVAVYEPTKAPLDFYTVTPCRLVDTRQNQSPLSTGTIRTFAVVGACGIPPEARAASFNVTAVGATAGGYMTLFPADQLQPQTGTVSFVAGQVRSNNAVIGLSEDGRIGAVAALGAGQADLVLDVNGYFASTPHPTFTRISDMMAPRSFPCAAKLGDGKVLIAGGTGTGHDNPLSSAELYDPATRTFVLTGNMTVPRDRPACVTLPDGRVLVGGGATALFSYTNSAEVYNPASGTFTAVGNMTTPRGEGWHAFAVPGGALLFGGTYEGSYGTATPAVDRFDVASSLFSRVGTLAAARRDYTAQMLSDGTALLVGGVLRYDLPVSLAAELYNVSTSQPISIGQPTYAPRVRSWSSTVLPGGDVLVTSGAGFPSEIYRRATRVFQAVNGAPSLYATDYADAVSLSDGKVLLLGYGRASGQGGRIAEVFDPAGGIFTTVEPMKFSSECPGYAATVLNDGTVLITGGGTPGNCGKGIPVAEIFKP